MREDMGPHITQDRRVNPRPRGVRSGRNSMPARAAQAADHALDGDLASGLPKFPPDAPDGAWEKMAPADQEIVNRIFVNFGKATGAYVRQLVSKNAPFDKYVAPQALRGQGQLRGVPQESRFRRRQVPQHRLHAGREAGPHRLHHRDPGAGSHLPHHPAPHRDGKVRRRPAAARDRVQQQRQVERRYPYRQAR